MTEKECKNWAIRLSNFVDLYCEQKRIGVNSLNFLRKNKLEGVDVAIFRLHCAFNHIRLLAKKNSFLTKEELILVSGYFVEVEKEKGFSHQFLLDIEKDFFMYKNTFDERSRRWISEISDFYIEEQGFKFDLKLFYATKESELISGLKYKKVEGTSFYLEELSEFESFIRENDSRPQKKLLDINDESKCVCFGIKKYEELLPRTFLSLSNIYQKHDYYLSKSVIEEILKSKNKLKKKKMLALLRKEVFLKETKNKLDDDYGLDILSFMLDKEEETDIKNTAESKYIIEKIRTLSDEDLFLMLCGYQDLSNKTLNEKKELDNLIKNQLFSFTKSKFSHLYEDMISALFSRLSSEIRLFVYKEDSFFEKGYFKILDTKNMDDFLNIVNEKKINITTNYKSACLDKNKGISIHLEYSSSVKKRQKFRNKIESLSDNDKAKLLECIFTGDISLADYSFSRSDYSSMKSLRSFCSEEDSDLLELNYEDDSEPMYEILFKNKTMSNYGNELSLKNINKFIKGLNDMGILLNFNLEEYTKENLQYITTSRQ